MSKAEAKLRAALEVASAPALRAAKAARGRRRRERDREVNGRFARLVSKRLTQADLAVMVV
jgi:hypothetical protein